jgi:hypothetical protein
MDMNNSEKGVNNEISAKISLDGIKQIIDAIGGPSVHTYKTTISSMVKHVGEDMHYIFANPVKACDKMKQNNVGFDRCKRFFMITKIVMNHIIENKEFRDKFDKIDQEPIIEYGSMMKDVYAKKTDEKRETTLQNTMESDDEADSLCIDIDDNSDIGELCDQPNSHDVNEHNPPNEKPCDQGSKNKIKILKVKQMVEHVKPKKLKRQNNDKGNDVLLDEINCANPESIRVIKHDIKQINKCMNEHNDRYAELISKERDTFARLFSEHVKTTQIEMDNLRDTIKKLNDKYDNVKKVIVPIIMAANVDAQTQLFRVLLDDHLQKL